MSDVGTNEEKTLELDVDSKEDDISDKAAVLNDIVKRKILKLAEKIKESQNKSN